MSLAYDGTGKEPILDKMHKFLQLLETIHRKWLTVNDDGKKMLTINVCNLHYEMLGESVPRTLTFNGVVSVRAVVSKIRQITLRAIQEQVDPTYKAPLVDRFGRELMYDEKSIYLSRDYENILQAGFKPWF